MDQGFFPVSTKTLEMAWLPIVAVMWKALMCKDGIPLRRSSLEKEMDMGAIRG